MWEFCVWVLFSYTVLSVLSSFENHLIEEETPGFVFKLDSSCHVAVSVLCLFLLVQWVGLQCSIVAFPGYTCLLFYGNI